MLSFCVLEQPPVVGSFTHASTSPEHYNAPLSVNWHALWGQRPPPRRALVSRAAAHRASRLARAVLPLPNPTGGEDVPLDYFLATAVLGKLSETAEKGFLGSFKGAAGEWEKVVKAYEYNRELLGL